MFARLLMASLMGIALLTIPVSRSSADGTIPDANHPFHLGDMPTLRADDKGVALYERVTSRVTVAPGPLSLFDANGSSVIVHLNEDQGTTGVAGGSGGPRIACGVVETID
jgi:Cu-Zn family superoxide dismutase